MPQLNYSNKPYFDHGALEHISEVLGNLNISKPLICTDPCLLDIGMVDLIRNNISNQYTPVIFDHAVDCVGDYNEHLVNDTLMRRCGT